MTEQADTGDDVELRPLPPCRKCGSDDLVVIEHHLGFGMWGETLLGPDGEFVFTNDGWSDSQPTGKWSIRCMGCEHEWNTKRRP